VQVGLAAVCYLCIAQPALQALSSAGGFRFSDSEDPGGLTATAAGIYRSLAIKNEPCQYVVAGDLNNDCRLDLADFAIMTLSLVDCSLNPEDPARIPK